jgi:predicted hydrocarbon binding protein
MFKYLNKKRQKGQSTLEYAILIIIIIGALMSIQVYIKRGIQGRLKSATDDIGTQFSPGNTNVIKKMQTSSYSSETFYAGVTRSELLSDEVTSDLMNSDVMNVQQEFWGKAQ